MSLTNIKFYEKSSASPTNIYFADYNGNGIEEKVVMKVYVDFISEFYSEPCNSIAPKKLAKTYNKYISDLFGLEYETAIYSRIIKKIIDNNYSPNFVEFVDFKTYNLEEFINMVDQSTYTPKQKLYNFIKTINGLQEITCCLNYNISDDLYTRIISNFNVKCLITKEPINIVTIRDLFTNYELREDEFCKVIFQLIYSLTLMDIIKLQHNDLHMGNILIERLDKPVDLYYIIDDNEKFKIKTNYVVRIFDWDSSYIETVDTADILYRNKLMTTNLNTGGHNVFIKGFDLYTLLCMINSICYNKTNSFCTYNFMKKIFCEAFSKGLMKYDNNKERYYVDTYDKFTKIGSMLHCRPNNLKNLAHLDYVGDILFSTIFNQFIYTSTIPSNAKIYRLPKEI